jgi:serine/threonine-protein kinase
MTTDKDTFRAAMELVDRVLDAPSERDEILRACANDTVRGAAERLLDADDHAGEFLATPATERTGASFGPFRLVSILGRGGMGDVWVAERVGEDFEQRVALKLLPIADDAGIARFRRERRILARLSHPHIAKLVDGGVGADGRPWLAMELVDGLHLTDHVREEQLDIESRLRLFVRICDAVQFAHRNLVVHRDLKPSNILVDRDGAPKLLDFGIAKILEEDTDDGLTRTEERPMTLEYAAPEQVRGEAVTTASDVWTLGVILFELLTGARPFGGKNRVETEAAIVAAIPTRPSSVIDSADKRVVRGDLDAIVLKALRSEPNARYPSAEALGADVQRHLDHAPVAARGDATTYLLRAMVRRHRAAFGFSALALLVLVVGLVGTLWQAHRAREEARRAEQAERYLVSMLRAFDPERAGGNPITQREILERGEARLEELRDQPEVQARLLETFAEIWFDLEDYDHAEPTAERALAIDRRIAPHSIGVAKMLVLLGQVAFERGQYPEAIAKLEEALRIAQGIEGARGLTVAKTLNELAGVDRRTMNFARAEQRRREALDIYRERLGERDSMTVDVTNDLAVLIGDEGRFDEAAHLQEPACKAMTDLHGDAHPSTLSCRSNLARDWIELGRPGEAETLLVEIERKQIAALGADWGDIAQTKMFRARAADALGRLEDATVLFEDALARLTAKFGSENPILAATLEYESITLSHAGRRAEAEVAARRALAMASAHWGEDHATTARAHYALGLALGDGGRSELERALATQQKLLGASHVETTRTQQALQK